MYDQIREKRSQILERAGLLGLLSLPSAGELVTPPNYYDAPLPL